MWNGSGTGPRHYSDNGSGEDLTSRARATAQQRLDTRDQQQLDAVSVLASFGQAFAAAPAAAYDPSHYTQQVYPASRPAMSRQYSDSRPYLDGAEAQRPPSRTQYYPHDGRHESEDNLSSSGRSYHSTKPSSYLRETSESSGGSRSGGYQGLAYVDEYRRLIERGSGQTDSGRSKPAPAVYDGTGYHHAAPDAYSRHPDLGLGHSSYARPTISSSSFPEVAANVRAQLTTPNSSSYLRDEHPDERTRHSTLKGYEEETHDTSQASARFAGQDELATSRYHQNGHPRPLSSSSSKSPSLQYQQSDAEDPEQRLLSYVQQYQQNLSRQLHDDSDPRLNQNGQQGREMVSGYQQDEDTEESPLTPNSGHGSQMMMQGHPESADSGDSDADDSVDTETPPPAAVAKVQPRGKPEAMARALAAARLEAERRDTDESDIEDQKVPAVSSEAVATKPSPKRPSVKSPKRSNVRKKTSRPTSVGSSSLLSASRREFLLGENVPRITEAEYTNLEELLTQFCRVPLLSEFSRPVSLLHPEITEAYSKIISSPVDLGHVCRGVRHRQYQSCRDVRLDMWLVFANCVKYNSHPSNKDAVPSFVSIALHLREYFNNLWQEYMLPSDLPPPPTSTEDAVINAYEILKAAYTKRDQERQRRIDNSGILVLSKQFIGKAAARLLRFIENGGCVDALDTVPLFGSGGTLNGGDIDLVVDRLRQFQSDLLEASTEESAIEYTLDTLRTDIRSCYTEDVLEDNPAARNRFSSRLDRLFWKQAAPLHEANSRGVTQSSIWGNLAATIWARESSKKPFWPALCLGILPPPEQREGWHQAITERNEGRLPDKLRNQLMIAKQRCEQAQKRQHLSYFLVEFLGTHEFIWIRETDIVENFDPNEDPNKSAKAGPKKSRPSRNAASNLVGSKPYAKALEECVWANEEYESVLQDAFEFSGEVDSDEDDEEMNYSFNVLAQSDDEADQTEERGYKFDEESMSVTDVDEANWLLSHDGLFDASAAGRKNAKKRSQALKKKTAPKKDDSPAKKRPKSKERGDDTNERRDNGRLDKKERREVLKRRKKRLREREKSLARKKMKRRRSGPESTDDDDRGLTLDKRARASAIVKAYLMRLAKADEGKSLALSGVMTMPAAMVDSTGLLGMALAFRAASGEFRMPDDGKEQEAKLRPWSAIDANGPKTAADRTDLLQKKVDLLEKEVSRVRSDSEKRRMLAAEYGQIRRAAELAAEADELVARQNPFKKKKKAPSKAENGGDQANKLESLDETRAASEEETNQDKDTSVGEEVDDHYDTDPDDSILVEEASDADEQDDPMEVTAVAMEVD